MSGTPSTSHRGPDRAVLSFFQLGHLSRPSATRRPPFIDSSVRVVLDGNLLSIQRPGRATHGADEIEILDGSARAIVIRQGTDYSWIGDLALCWARLAQNKRKGEGSILQPIRHRSCAQKSHDASLVSVNEFTPKSGPYVHGSSKTKDHTTRLRRIIAELIRSYQKSQPPGHEVLPRCKRHSEPVNRSSHDSKRLIT